MTDQEKVEFEREFARYFRLDVKDGDQAMPWQLTYPHQPSWWNIPEEPRCDHCGVHAEDAYLVRGGWCGECGNCFQHCISA